MADVQVTVETPSENQIIAVEFSGQEIIQPPLTLAEHFAKQASRIDFNEVDEDNGVEENDNDTQEEEEQEDEGISSYTGILLKATLPKISKVPGGYQKVLKLPG
jgi:hypothetical protein